MTAVGTVFLIYHELRGPGRQLSTRDPGSARYAVAEADFRMHLMRLREAGLRGVSVGDALTAPAGGAGVVLTFDDGFETDLLIAAPILRQAGFAATCYVTVGFLGRRGYLTPAQLRALAEFDVEIGSHSMTHSYLPGLPDGALRHEIGDSRAWLQEFTGRRVAHFACPGGRWSPRVAAMARAAGYESVATSRVGTNGPSCDPFRLRRIPVLHGTSSDDLVRLCRFGGPLALRARGAILMAAKRALGDVLYEQLRARVLRGG